MKVVPLFLLLSACALAQTSAGSITGSVKDPQQSVIPGVKVTATNLATNVPQVATTSSAGVYLLPALEPGTYRIVAETPGFKKLTQEPITVETARTITLDLSLEVGDTSSTVTITADAALVQQATSTVQYGINQKALDELPLPNQSALGVLMTVPGVAGDPGSEQGETHTGLITPGTGVSVGGGRPGETQYQADGVSNSAIYQGRISLSFSSDALQEVTVQQNSYSAEYGRVGGGIVNMTTKSGTNELHGTMFSFLKNDAFNAGPYQNAWARKSMLRYWRGGTDFGGPVYLPKVYDGRNRTFFFFGYEPLRQHGATPAFARVPTSDERNGDFSKTRYSDNQDYPTTIFRQFEFDPAGNLTTTKIKLAANQAYPQWEGNIIPKRYISPIGQRILNLYPLPNMTPLVTGENYYQMRSVRNTDNRYMVKLDQSITSNDRVSFRLSRAPTLATRGGIGVDFLENAPTDQSYATNASFSFIHILDGTKLNDFRAGYTRSNIARRENDVQLSKNYFAEYGFPTTLDKGFPLIAMNPGGNHFFNAGWSVGNYEIDNSLQLIDTFSWTRGRHSIKTGFEYRAPQQNLIDYGGLQGSWAFGPNVTSIGSGNTATYPGLMTPSATTGYVYASVLLGYPDSVTMAPAAVPYQYRWKYYAGFLQDDFKLTSKLTLNLGVRYQVEVPRSEKHHNQGTFVPETVTNSNGGQQVGYLQMQGLGGTGSTLFPTRYNNIEPRIGLAYRPPRWIKGLSVIRAAYAISHVPTSTMFNMAIPNLNPPAQSMAASGGKNGSYVQMDTNPLVPPTKAIVWPSDGKYVDLQNLTNVNYINPNVTIPYMQQWNFGLGFTFGRSYGVEATYVGSKGTNLFGPSAKWNTVDREAYTELFNQGVNMAATFPNPAGLKDLNGKVVQVTQTNLLRPIPTVGAIDSPLGQGGNSSYNALQIQLQKRLSHGFQFNANYTFSKSMDTSSCAGQFCGGALGPWFSGAPQLYGGDRKLEHSVSIYDLPHNLRFSYNWDLPFGHGRTLLGGAKGILNGVIGNWKLSGLGSMQSGPPLTLYNGSNSSGTNAGWPDDVGYMRPNIVLGVNPINPNWRANLNTPGATPDPYLNRAAFTPTTRLQLGTVPRTMPWLRGPRTTKYDMSILKEFPIREKVKVAFRAELYGALNHPFFTVGSNKFATYTSLDYVRYVNPPVATSNLLTSWTDMSSSSGGTRTIQLGLKLYF